MIAPQGVENRLIVDFKTSDLHVQEAKDSLIKVNEASILDYKPLDEDDDDKPPGVHHTTR